jgi:hypothetical protein
VTHTKPVLIPKGVSSLEIPESPLSEIPPVEMTGPLKFEEEKKTPKSSSTKRTSSKKDSDPSPFTEREGDFGVEPPLEID